MKDTAKLIIYGLIGVTVGYLFYKFTKSERIPLPKPEEEKKEIVLIKIPIPKGVGESKLQKIVQQLKPSRTMPSFKPLGVILEWSPIYIDTPIGPFTFTPPKKFISLKTISEVKRAIQESQVKIEDKGLYWQITLTLEV